MKTTLRSAIVVALCTGSLLAVPTGFMLPDQLVLAPGETAALLVQSVGSGTADGMTLVLETTLPIEIPDLQFLPPYDDGQTIEMPYPNVAVGYVTMSTSPPIIIPDAAALARVSIYAPLGTAPGVYSISTFSATLGMGSSYGDMNPTEPAFGTIIVTPEPTTALLLLALLPLVRRRPS